MKRAMRPEGGPVLRAGALVHGIPVAGSRIKTQCAKIVLPEEGTIAESRPGERPSGGRKT